VVLQGDAVQTSQSIASSAIAGFKRISPVFGRMHLNVWTGRPFFTPGTWPVIACLLD
jgi:hypothetical protein